MPKINQAAQTIGILSTFLSGSLMGGESSVQKDEWVKTHLFENQAKILFSFIYADQGSGKLLAEWPRQYESKKLDAARTQHTIRWTDPKTGLEVRCMAVDYSDFPTVEWTVFINNTGKVATAIIEQIHHLGALQPVP